MNHVCARFFLLRCMWCAYELWWTNKASCPYYNTFTFYSLQTLLMGFPLSLWSDCSSWQVQLKYFSQPLTNKSWPAVRFVFCALKWWSLMDSPQWQRHLRPWRCCLKTAAPSRLLLSIVFKGYMLFFISPSLAVCKWILSQSYYETVIMSMLTSFLQNDSEFPANLCSLRCYLSCFADF